MLFFFKKAKKKSKNEAKYILKITFQHLVQGITLLPIA